MKTFVTLLALMMGATLSSAFAGDMASQVMHWGGFPTPVGEVAKDITYLYNIIFIITAVVMGIVVLALGYIMVRFRRVKGVKPATFSHSLSLELLWTVIPALICFYIAYASAISMVKLRTMPEDAMVVEAVAYQFGWDFYYPDASVAGKLVAAPEPTTDDAEISLPGAPRQVKTMLVPVGKSVVLHITAKDVLHAFFVPTLGIKMDAIPGRINYAWFKADKPGNWLGQCAELCGQAHGEMFFRVKAVPQDEFDAFIATQRKEAGIEEAPVSGTVVVPAALPVVASPTTMVSPSI